MLHSPYTLKRDNQNFPREFLRKFSCRKGERIALDALLFFAVLFLPWWIFASLAIFGLWRFRNFGEAVLAAFFFDALYALGYLFFLASLALFIALAIIKSRVRG